MTIRHDLKGLVAGTPGRCRRRTNQSTPILEAAPSSSSRQPRLHGRKRHYVLNSAPIEPCRRPLPKDDDPGICFRIPERCPSLRDEYHALEHALRRIKQIASQIRNHGTAVDGRRFVKASERWVNLRVDHNSTVTLISELGDRQASVDFRFTANYHASEAVVGLIQIEGNILWEGDAKALVKGWSAGGQMPPG